MARVRMLGDAHELLGDFRGGKHVVHHVFQDGTARHAVVLGRRLILRQGYAAFRLDGLEAERAVRAASGKNDADGPTLEHLGQRSEQVVDGHVLAACRGARRERQRAVGQGHVLIGGNQVDVVYFDRHAFGRFLHRECVSLVENLRQMAFVMWFEVHDEKNGQTWPGRQMPEQLGNRLQSPRRAANPHDGKPVARL